MNEFIQEGSQSSFGRMISQIDVQKSKAKNKDDKQAIFDVVEKEIGGFQKLNTNKRN
jgi:hypothetical protein